MNFVCIVFELGDKIVVYGKPNSVMQPKGQLMRLTLSWFFAHDFEKLLILAGNYSSFS